MDLRMQVGTERHVGIFEIPKDLSELSRQELQNLYEEIRRELRDLQSERDEIDDEIEAKRLVQEQIDYEIRDRQLVPGEEHPIYRKKFSISEGIR